VGPDQHRVVGVVVQPSSKATTLDAQSNPDCNTDRPMIISENDATKVIYTYSVSWRVSPLHLQDLTNSIHPRNGPRDGINIYMYLILEFIGSVLLILPLSSFFSLEWSQWFSFVLYTRISLGTEVSEESDVGTIKWICKRTFKKILDGN
jgi:hypothetical protein